MTSKTVEAGGIRIEVFRATVDSRIAESALSVRLVEAFGKPESYSDRIRRGTFIRIMSLSKTDGAGALDTLDPQNVPSKEEVAEAFQQFRTLDADVWDMWNKTMDDVNSPVNAAHLTPSAKKKTSPTKSS